MPLIKSKSKEAVGENVKTEMAHGKPQKQAVAIALNTQRAAGGGKPAPKKHKPSGKAMSAALRAKEESGESSPDKERGEKY